MKNRLRDHLRIIMIIAIFLGGCGGGGKDSSGVAVQATITPTYTEVNTASVDAVQSLCRNPSDGTVQGEYYADHGATVSISASLVNPSNTIKQIAVTIDRYTVAYRSLADSPGAPPIQSDVREKTISFIVSGSDTASAELSVAFVDLLRKDQYLADVTSGGYSSGSAFLNNYTATYTFEGHSENGVPFTFTSQTDFQIGSFNNCTPPAVPI